MTHPDQPAKGAFPWLRCRYGLKQASDFMAAHLFALAYAASFLAYKDGTVADSLIYCFLFSSKTSGRTYHYFQ